MADDHVFISGGDIENQIGRIRDASDALKLAIEFEKDTVLFFLSLEEAVAGKKDWEFIKSLLKEEQEHVRRLTLELRKMTSGK
jgi:rubrerythrin